MKLFKQNFRVFVLLLTTACLSMMLANILTLNFTILCMTEGKFSFEDFTIDLKYELFERVNFNTPNLFDTKETDFVDNDTDNQNIEIPGILETSPGFTWQNFHLSRQNPQLFLRLLKTVIYQSSKLAAKQAGEQFDPKKIDFYKFWNGFNLTNLNPNVAVQIKDFIIHKTQKAKNSLDIYDDVKKKFISWEKVNADDIFLNNVTWNGVLNGKIRIIDQLPDYYYTSNQKALLFAIVAIGALISIGFVCYSMRRYGCRKTFTVVGIISAISTALCPLAASIHFFVFLLVRCIQGIGFAACMPVIGAVTASWAKISENGFFNGVFTSFIQLGPVIAMPISGILCLSSLGWQTVFYVHAAITVFLIGFWWFIYRDSPCESNYMSNTELYKIQADKIIDGHQKHNQKKFPFKKIFNNLSVWAVWAAACGNMFAIQTLILFAPTYINKVLLYSIISVGFASAVPTFIQFIVKILAGISSDKITRFTETKKLKIFNSIAFFGMAFFLILLAICPVPGSMNVTKLSYEEKINSNWRVAALFLLIIAAAILGFNVGGFFKSATLIGREYAYFINTKIQIIMCIAILTVPFFVYTIAPNNEPGGWSCIFIVLAILLIITNAIFLIYGTANPTDFGVKTTIKEENNDKIVLNDVKN